MGLLDVRHMENIEISLAFLGAVFWSTVLGETRNPHSGVW